MWWINVASSWQIPLQIHLLSSLFVCLGLFRSQSECVAIEALQICTLLLPPSSRRKLQLLMRMMCRISQNVDMPRLHPAIGTRTLVRLRGGQQMSSPLHQSEHQKHFISHQKCLSVNIFRWCFHFLFASLSLLSLICYSPPPRWCIHFQAASWAVLWSVIWMSCWLPGWFLFFWITKNVSSQSQSTCWVL